MIKIKRNQLARIIGNDPEAIRAFEDLFDVVDTLDGGTPGVIYHSSLTLDDGTNPHGTLPSDVGISAFGETLVDDADAATARTTLGLVSVASEGTHSSLTLDDGTNPHGTTKDDVGTPALLLTQDDAGRTARAATGDWDSYESSGLYIGNELTNKPYDGDAYVMVVRDDDTNTVQIAYDAENGVIYQRIQQSGVWTDWAETSGGGSGGGMEIGTIFPYAGSAAPVGSLLCDGSAISRTEYADLFAAIGTTWGVGDGSTTFNVPPDLNDITPGATDVTWCIKATPATNSGTPLPTYSYSTGWVGPISDWTNAEIIVNHGLNAAADDLIMELWVSVSSDGSNPFKVESVEHNSTSFTAGLAVYGIDNSSFKYQTGASGVFVVNDDGSVTLLAANSRYYKVKVYRPEVLATELATTKYDTGWVANSDWTNQEFTITHNLGRPLPELITKFFISTDGTDATAFEVVDGDLWKNTSLQSAEGRGVTYMAINDSSLKVQTASSGITFVTDSGSVGSLDTEAWYYRVVVYKPELISNVTPAAVKSVSADYTITGRDDSRIIQVTTGASNLTITLPAGSGLIPGDEFEVMKADSGAGEVTVSRAGSDAIDGVTSVDLYSQRNKARVRWTGSEWTVVELQSNGLSGTAGTNDYTYYELHANGGCDFYIRANLSGGWNAYSFPFTLADANHQMTGGAKSNGAGAIGYQNKTTTGFEIYIASSGISEFQVHGRWRA